MLALTVFFSPYDAYVWQYIPLNGYLNGLSDEQPWTSWGGLFSDPISPLCSECPVPCRPQVNSRYMPCASLHATALSQCLIINIIIIVLILIIIIIITSPPLTLEYLGGGKARNFWEIFHLTTWNILPPTYFFGLLKDVGGGSSGRCSFLDLFSPYAGRAHAQTLTTR